MGLDDADSGVEGGVEQKALPRFTKDVRPARSRPGLSLQHDAVMCDGTWRSYSPLGLPCLLCSRPPAAHLSLLHHSLTTMSTTSTPPKHSQRWPSSASSSTRAPAYSPTAFHGDVVVTIGDQNSSSPPTYTASIGAASSQSDPTTAKVRSSPRSEEPSKWKTCGIAAAGVTSVTVICVPLILKRSGVI